MERRAKRSPAAPPRRSAIAEVWPYLLVMGAAFAVFAPSLGNSFLNWDDRVYVLENPWIRALTWRNLEFMLTHPYFNNYLPLHLLSYALDYRLWGLQPFGFHLSSVLLHAVNSALSYYLIRKLTGNPAVALLTALLFAVHPSHVESVAWVSSRKDLLSMVFALLSTAAYTRARAGRGLAPAPYAASLVFFALGLLSKTVIVLLPGFLLLLDAWPHGKPSGPRAGWRNALWNKIPYLVLGAVVVLINDRAQVKTAAPYAEEPMRYLMVKGHAVWNYLALLTGLRSGNPDYDLPRMGHGPLEILVNLAGLGVVPGMAYALWRLRRRNEFLGVSWMYVMLLPAILFPLVTYMADRYLYAPSLGFCWALSTPLVELHARGHKGRSRAPAAVAVAAGILLVAGFTARAISYERVWKSSESLWTYAMTKSHDFRVYNNLANVRMGQKRWEEAERLLKRGAEVENVVSYQALGVLYYSLGRWEEALQATDRAIAIEARTTRDPAVTSELHFNRGAVFWARGDSARATAEWRVALQENPGHEQARLWLGTATGVRKP